MFSLGKLRFVTSNPDSAHWDPCLFRRMCSVWIPHFPMDFRVSIFFLRNFPVFLMEIYHMFSLISPIFFVEILLPAGFSMVSNQFPQFSPSMVWQKRENLHRKPAYGIFLVYISRENQSIDTGFHIFRRASNHQSDLYSLSVDYPYNNRLSIDYHLFTIDYPLIIHWLTIDYP